MQFLLIARDDTDSKAIERRMAVRPNHLEKVEKMKGKGEFILGGAILDDAGQMRGSVVLYEFPDRMALDLALKDEPYITGGVWKEIEIKPFRLASINAKYMI